MLNFPKRLLRNNLRNLLKFSIACQSQTHLAFQTFFVQFTPNYAMKFWNNDQREIQNYLKFNKK